MSGAFGWVRNDNAGHTQAVGRPDQGYTQAVQRYRPRNQTTPPTSPPPSQPAQRVLAKQTRAGLSTPGATHNLKSSAAHVIICVLDVTASMRDWPQEIFRRLPLLYQSAVDYIGSDDLEILFIAHADTRCDSHPIQVTRFGRGPELDDHLASLAIVGGGGGQGSESQELVAYYLATKVDLSAAQNVYTFFVTDETGCDHVSERDVQEHLGDTLEQHLSRADTVFDALKRSMTMYAILCDTGSNDTAHTRRWWENMMSGERIVPLDDARRIVDVLLGVIALNVGAGDRFMTDLSSRQAGTQHGAQNIATVKQSISLVGRGSPSDPYRLPSGTRTKPLLPTPDDA